ncbi:hypothetical protein JTE90_013902 [Oedothorax gibbosus]|uniref:Uncharacterized protein n=1 Tax=Oedothorax gibbosus TaxID=931172 RepID=A0AAV6VF71_9ARAC|nr:hypothetical protein JTE90_013902 [Oedothorax gibbosus]
MVSLTALCFIVVFGTSALASEYSQLITDNTSGFRLGPKPSLVEESSTDSIDVSLNSDSSGDETDVYHEMTVGYPDYGKRKTSSYASASKEKTLKIKTPAYRKQRSRKVYPGQFSDKRKNQNWKTWPEYTKGSVSPSDTKLAWSYWEEDEHELYHSSVRMIHSGSSVRVNFGMNDAPTITNTQIPLRNYTHTQTPKPTTKSTTTSTSAPTTTKAKPPVSIHKHFHYFKKPSADDPWKKGESMMPTTAMPTEEMMDMKMPEMMMKMPDEMMMEMMMKGMMMMPPPPDMPSSHPDMKGGKGKIAGIFDKLAKVDPITVLVAGIVPASLILAAALPAVMKVVMKDDTSLTMPIPMVTTTAVSGGDDDMTTPATRGSRLDDVDSTMARIVEAVGDFGKRALERPHCAREMICQLAKDTIVADSPVVRKAMQFAEVAMEDSWLDHLGVRSIFTSLNDNTCHQVECEKENWTNKSEDAG